MLKTTLVAVLTLLTLNSAYAVSWSSIRRAVFGSRADVMEYEICRITEHTQTIEALQAEKIVTPDKDVEFIRVCRRSPSIKYVDSETHLLVTFDDDSQESIVLPSKKLKKYLYIK